MADAQAIHSLNQDSESTCCVLTVPAPRDTAVTKVERHPCPHGIYILGQGRGKGWTREESNIRNVLDNEKCGEGKKMKHGDPAGGHREGCGEYFRWNEQSKAP